MYKNAGAAKIGIIVHIIVVAYMLLGLNTVCDLYFTGALDVLVEKYEIQADVAGATFMAAGGSAPELFTSLIGAVVTENDVGFGTIVGSAVFNVLAVIGACGVSALKPIPLTWWPLFRDCVYYIIGLALLAAFSFGSAIDCADGTKQGGGSISLLEAILLFLAYIIYCIIMFYNTKLEGIVNKNKKTQAEPVEEGGVPEQEDGVEQIEPVPSPEEASKEGVGLRNAASSDLENRVPPPDHHIGVDANLDKAPRTGNTSENDVTTMQVPGAVGEKRTSSNNSSGHMRGSVGHAKAPGDHHHHGGGVRVGKHHRVVVDKDGQKHEIHSSPRPEGEQHRRTSQAGKVDSAALAKTMKAEEGAEKTIVQDVKDSDDEGEKVGLKSAPDVEKGFDHEEKKEPAELEDPDEVASGGSTDSDDIDALMIQPKETLARIQWALSLPIYAPMYYCIPRPDGPKGFIPAFVMSLVFIAGFSFLLVYCVELFGKAILGGGNNVTIVMSFTLLAAGTSIPDLVSSMAVARASQGDMAVSSSIGSNIFDILVGLPVPWIIKIGFVDMLGSGKSYNDAQVHIRSPYIALYVMLLLFMVFCVILSIHLLKWRLNFQLGLAMAILYLVFLAIVLPVELVNKGPYL
jgi:K+-dependent Na+/Ca+ exchanger-like protein